jgi:hypothetical protein
MLYTNQVTKIKKITFWPNPTLSKGPLVVFGGQKFKKNFSRNPEDIFFLIVFFCCQVILVTKKKKIEDDTLLEFFLS